MENEFDKKLAQTVDKPKASFKGKIKDLEKSEKGDGQKNDKLNKMIKKTQEPHSKRAPAQPVYFFPRFFFWPAGQSARTQFFFGP